MRGVAVAMASLGLLLGIGFAFAAAWSWFNPVGMQIANDADPFGAPPSRGESAYVFVFAAAVAAVSARILWFGRGDSVDDSGVDDSNNDSGDDDA
jgi:hypothetical protein